MNIDKKWKRFKNDYKYGLFVKHPYEMSIIEYKLDEWLQELDAKFQNGTFEVSDMQICEVPKGKGLLRPGSILKTQDVLFFIHLVSEAFTEIYEHLKWSQGKVDFSYILNESGKTEFKWLANQFQGWEGFRTESIKQIDEGTPYVIITDITGYYENIHIMKLFEDLRSAGIDAGIAAQIKKCLDKWSIIQGKGIPQSIGASHILGKLYLNGIDLAMSNKGFKMIRYVDDIRIFCNSKTEAKQALMYLSQLMRERGLNLQSAKTKIHRADEAREIIEGVQKIIQTVESQINSQADVVPLENNVADLSRDQEVEEEYNNYDGEDLNTLKATFKAYFLDEDTKFDKTLFRYLINRIGKSKDRIALDYCIRNLEKHPQETDTFFKYFMSIDAQEDILTIIFQFMESEDAIYGYQKYQIISWISANYESLGDDYKRVIREIANDGNNPNYLISVARESLSKFGNIADLDELMGKYNTDLSELEKVEILCSIGKMERTKRNAFYGHRKSESLINEKTIKWIKENDV